jgi:hypothetical protein
VAGPGSLPWPANRESGATPERPRRGDRAQDGKGVTPLSAIVGLASVLPDRREGLTPELGSPKTYQHRLRQRPCAGRALPKSSFGNRFSTPKAIAAPSCLTSTEEGNAGRADYWRRSAVAAFAAAPEPLVRSRGGPTAGRLAGARCALKSLRAGASQLLARREASERRA